MRRGYQRKPLFEGRGFLLVDDFCRITGVDRPTVQALMTAGRLDGVFDDQGQALGLWDDVLPTSEQLRQMGLLVNREYAPDKLRSTSHDDLGDEAAAEDSGSTWK